MATVVVECPIWRTEAELVSERDYGDKKTYDSPRAGGLYEANTAILGIRGLKQDQRIKLTTLIVDHNRLGTPLYVNSQTLERLNAVPKMSVGERRDRLLHYLNDRIDHSGQGVPISGEVTVDMQKSMAEMLAWTESVSDPEIYYLINACMRAGFSERIASDYIGLTIDGYNYLASLGLIRNTSSQAFIALWFDESMDSAYDDGFSPAVIEAGNQPIRIDQKEHVNKIDDEIVAEIRRSRFLVADFTSPPQKPRGGVYFEAGFAFGLNIPVI